MKRKRASGRDTIPTEHCMTKVNTSTTRSSANGGRMTPMASSPRPPATSHDRAKSFWVCHGDCWYRRDSASGEEMWRLIQPGKAPVDAKGVVEAHMAARRRRYDFLSRPVRRWWKEMG